MSKNTNKLLEGNFESEEDVFKKLLEKPTRLGESKDLPEVKSDWVLTDFEKLEQGLAGRLAYETALKKEQELKLSMMTLMEPYFQPQVRCDICGGRDPSCPMYFNLGVFPNDY